MKKLFALSMLIPFAMICSCQKQDSAAERQLAQRKAELEASEKASDEREKELEALAEKEKALAEKEKALAEKEKALAEPQSRGQIQNPAQWEPPAHWEAERDKRIQQLPAEVRVLLEMQEQLAKEKRRSETGDAMPATEQLNRMKTDAAKKQSFDDATSAAKASLGAESTSPPSLAVYPQPEATSPSSGLTPAAVFPSAEASSPTPSPTPQ
jgi:myosin heavy subunit